MGEKRVKCCSLFAGLTKRIKGSGGSKLDLEMDEFHMKALDGFLLVVSTDGRVIYTSENIVTYLGHHQVRTGSRNTD